MKSFDPQEAVGKSWPKLDEAHLPSWYRDLDLDGGPRALEVAKRELAKHFLIEDLSTSEGVYLRWCVQYALRQYQGYAAEIASGNLTPKMQINPIQEAVLRWVNDLYVDGPFNSDILETYIRGQHFGERGQRYRDMLDLIRAKRFKTLMG